MIKFEKYFKTYRKHPYFGWRKIATFDKYGYVGYIGIDLNHKNEYIIFVSDNIPLLHDIITQQNNTTSYFITVKNLKSAKKIVNKAIKTFYKLKAFI